MSEFAQTNAGLPGKPTSILQGIIKHWSKLLVTGVVLAGLVLAFRGSDLVVGHLVVVRQNVGVPPACRVLITEVGDITTNIAQSEANLATLQNAAVEYDQKYKHPDYQRYWSELGGMQNSAANWQKVTDRRAEISTENGKLNKSLEAISKACSLPH